MDFREIKIFLHLSQSLHFSQTSKVMHLSPSTLSRTIQRIEEELKQKLFERDNRSVKLTKEGKQFVEFSQNVLHQWQSLKTSFERKNNAISGELTLFCTVTAAHIYVPRLLEEFRKQYPLAEIKLETGDVALAYEKINDQSVDFAFAVLPEKLSQKYSFHSIEHVPFKLIGPTMNTSFSKHMGETKINWDQLPFVMPEAGPARERLLDWLTQMKLKPEVYAKVSGHEAIVSMTALGCGVSAIPLPVLEHSPLKDKVKILPASIPPLPLELGIVCLKKRLSTPLNKVFWELVQDVYQNV
ncbi:MAG: HTH-type transcriptional activator IlvY [Gammaproteobacteria bacterium]|nr:HTH-type transcriptional activator IlvY [Gammaproteobacteria bacterium]